MSLAAAAASAAGCARIQHRPPRTAGSIDRQALVARHNPVVTKIDPFSALCVGNGEFAFTADVTGLQSFPEAYHERFPLCTTSQWAWHTTPAPPGVRAEELRYRDYDTHGRPVGYPTDARGQETLFNWLRQNPHRFHLGRIGAEFTRSDDDSIARPEDLANIEQSLDMWTGVIESRFELQGRPVRVQTCCHPNLDLLALRIESPLLSDGRMRIVIAFPYASPEIAMADWNAADRHHTQMTSDASGHTASFARTLDDTRYHVAAAWSHGRIQPRGRHEFVITTPSLRLDLVIHFSALPRHETLPSFHAVRTASAKRWQDFWTSGGAIDLSKSSDPRAPELERRIVLSQYLTTLHCAGSLPPAETGLLFNSWYGKFHTEMHWWHGVHFSAWNRFKLFERSLEFYRRILPVARQIAQRQGYRGVRWPKMVGPDGRESPSPVAPLLIWQQPHPIYYAELCYHRRPTRATLDRWRDIVFDSADFLADYAWFDTSRNQYVLGPPMKTVSENTDPQTTINPTFELSYWRFGLRVAQHWRQRLEMSREPKWDDVLNRLAPLPVRDGAYLMQEGMADTYTKWNWEHPALLGALGMLPGDGVDVETMRRTVRRVMDVWQWDRAWGWDFPMAAMAAARCGEPELAVRALLIDSPKNRRHLNGHIYQRPNLTAYLPANGGLLSATAMMAAGWTGGPNSPAPGFPQDGEWSVRYDNLRCWI